MLVAFNQGNAQIRSIYLTPHQVIAEEDAASVATFLVTTLPSGIQFRAIEKRISPYATYFTFQQVIDGIPVENVQLKVTVQSNHIQYISGTYYQVQETDNVRVMVQHVDGLVFRVNDNKLEQYTRQLVSRGNNDLLFEYRTPDGQLAFVDDRRNYFILPDTLVHALVFLPDPITTAETTYGGLFVDMDDADAVALNNERVDLLMPATFENDTFFLRTENIVLKDLNVPVIPIAYALSDTFHYTREEDGFEDVQALFHLTNMVSYLTSIGYEVLTDFYIEVDPHGASGADQSFYVSASPPSIQFGVGGVDDAEDGDVIIHEYVHGLSDFASPASNTGLERRAIDEGYGDYFAASYSRGYSEYDWFNIFNWDAHNEYWAGRNANTNKHYPEDNSDNYYAASEIWSGALMDIYDIIGKEACDKIVCEALYASFANMTMHEAALALLEAEDLVYAQTYQAEIFDALYARGLVWPDDIADQGVPAEIQILNSMGFAFGSGPLSIQFPEKAHTYWQLIDISGHLIVQGEEENNSFQIAPVDAPPGVFCLRLNVDGQVFSTRLIIY